MVQQKTEALLCTSEIGVYNMFPMETQKHLIRYQAVIVYMYDGTELANFVDRRNKAVVRKKEEDALFIAKRWKQQIERRGLRIRTHGLYVI
jgi:hypothetical protein